MQKETQNKLYQKLYDVIPKNVLSKKNKNKSWKYGYDEKYDIIITNKEKDYRVRGIWTKNKKANNYQMKKILIINADYYKEITDQILLRIKRELKKEKVSLSLITVAGIFEIPIAIRRNIQKFDAFIVIGCAIKGKTPHFDLICKSSFDAIIQLAITYNKPISNGIITALNKKQAYERCGKIKSNKPNKGLEAARAVMSIIRNGPKKI